MDWEQIWREHWKEIYRYIYIKVHHPQEAEDLTQEVFMKAIRAEARYETEQVNAVALLKAIARNLIIDKWRSRQNRAGTVPIDVDMQLRNPGKEPDEIVEMQDEIQRAIALLTPSQRQVIEHRLLRGYSVKETAELVGRSEAYVKTTQFRAIEKIKQNTDTTTGGMRR